MVRTVALDGAGVAATVTPASGTPCLIAELASVAW